MVAFRKQLLTLSGSALLFAGMSFGQNVALTCNSNAFPSTVNGTALAGTSVTPAPIELRKEGMTELVSDLTFSCAAGGGIANGTLSAFLSAPVTSKVLPTPPVPGSGQTEAALILTDPNNANAIISVTYGTVSGNVVTFNNVTFPGTAYNGKISNVRVNASTVPLGSTPTPVTEQVFAGSFGSATFTSGALTVGYALTGLNTPGLVTGPNGIGTANVRSFVTCVGNPLGNQGISFAVTIAEAFGGAFKTQNGNAALANNNTYVGVTNGEQGSYVNPATGAGVANSGTRIQLTFANVPAAATLYVPTVINNGPLTLTLTASAVGVYSPVAASATVGAPAAILGGNGQLGQFVNGNVTTFETTAGSAAFTPANGSVTVVYEVTATNASVANETAGIPVYVISAANAVAAQGAITVLASFAPIAAPNNIPSFVAPSNTPLNGSTYNLCATSLLFPFVTNQLGFDTGLVISNTSSDPFGAVGAANQAGTCTLNFYGQGAPTPSTGVASPNGTQNTGTTNAFLLSGVAPGFQGYVIATCNYQYAHGFAYISYNLTQNNGTAMGYLALVLPNGAARGTINNVEVLGQ